MRIKTLALLAILFMGLSFVSCSPDDIDGNGGNNTEIVESLVGTWKWSDDEGYQLITFKSNGKGTRVEADEYGTYEESFSYSYNASKKILKINWDDDDPVEWTVTSLTSNKLVVKDEEGNKFTLTKQYDDENEGASGNELVGYWVRYEDNDQYMEEFGFFADGTCKYTEAFEPDDVNDEDPYYEFGKGTYVVKGNKLTMKLKFGDETEVWTYTIKNLKANNTLVLVDEEGYTYKFEYYLED